MHSLRANADTLHSSFLQNAQGFAEQRFRSTRLSRVFPRLWCVEFLRNEAQKVAQIVAGNCRWCSSTKVDGFDFEILFANQCSDCLNLTMQCGQELLQQMAMTRQRICGEGAIATACRAKGNA